MTSFTNSLHAIHLDGNGGGRAETATDLMTPYWLHLDCMDEMARSWLQQESRLDAITSEALLAEETRPRFTFDDSGALIVLRGVNLNPGADPEDMVSIRMWVDPERIISVRLRKLTAVQDTVDALLETKTGPKTPAGVAVYLVERLVHRMWKVISEMDDEVDQMEESLLGDVPPLLEMRRDLGQLRRQAVVLRRFLSPQREALSQMQAPDITLFDKRQKTRLREVSDRITRIIEDLDEVRERAALVRDEISSMAGERMNKTMYLLTLVASIMLPLGFLTGLLGINVAGIPGAENPQSFWMVVAGLSVLIAIEIWLFKKLKWL